MSPTSVLKEFSILTLSVKSLTNVRNICTRGFGLSYISDGGLTNIDNVYSRYGSNALHE